MSCYHYIIEGQVQGVFFRASTREQARKSGISGWVKNLPNGSVEAVACGAEQQLKEFESWLAQGPPLATVSHVRIEDWTQASDFSDFIIL